MIIIEEDVWLVIWVMIMKGVRIGKGVVVVVGVVVYEDVFFYILVVGVFVKLIR